MLNKNQFGFIKNVSVNECKFKANSIIKELRTNSSSRKRGSILFIDIKGAYDSVNRSLLFHLLEANNILSKNSIDLLKWLYKNITVRLGNYSTSTSKGVPQGMRTSPLLFNFYIDGILDTLHKSKIKALFFADDMAIFVEDRTQLREAIKIMES